ncbi:MAG: CDP-alcohol phosphatidyltransferase family protein [Propionibacteriaceae bacterium]|jgi:cardiolipin synthase|nr:CDP-alcohol phosphatidyltransferase family protein [Propionibacteriaceae bacterium]
MASSPRPIAVSSKAPRYDTTRVLTVPNVLSMLRLAGIPVFLWLVLGPHWDAAAVVLLVVSGVTDFVDGQVARRWHQVSRLGQVLDPIADRSYIIAIMIGLAVRGFLPWALVIVLLARDVMLAGLFPSLRARGYSSLPVHFLGKIATFCLLYAFPCVLLGQQDFTGAQVFEIGGWAVVLWGTFFYWWAAVLYMYQGVRLIRQTRR